MSYAAHRWYLYIWVLALLPIVARAQTLTVSPNGPVRSIQEAIDRADPGSTIVIKAGTYREPEIVVNKPLEIVGEGSPVVDGEQTRQILTIQSDSVTVRGITFRNVGTSFVNDRAAIRVEKSSYCTIEKNRFEDTYFGIYLAESSDCLIADNVLRGSKQSESRSANGIHLWYSKNVTIRGNDVSGHRDGIYLEFVQASVVTENASTGNKRYGLHFMFSDHCEYNDNVFRENDAGVAVMYTKNVKMTGNRFEDNWGSAAFGLLLKDITDSQVTNNVFHKNTVGIYAEGSNRIEVKRNDFIENGWAIKIMANAEDNNFSENNFVANSFDVATNSRQHFSTFEGNYWDNYQGYDLDRDGVGDVPFRPVRLFSLIVEQNEPALLLMRSFFVSLLDAAERVLPAITPQALVDEKPAMTWIR